MRTDRTLLLSLLAAGAGVAVGLTLDRRAAPGGPAPPGAGANLRARVVDEVPEDAVVVDADEDLLAVPVARAAARRAVRTDAREKWVAAAVDGDWGREVVETLQRHLPHYRAPDRADAHHDGVYVAVGDRVVLVTAASWAVVDAPDR